jgi:hypothetical protein
LSFLKVILLLQDSLLEVIDSLGLLRSACLVKGSLALQNVILQFIRGYIVRSLGPAESTENILELGLLGLWRIGAGWSMSQATAEILLGGCLWLRLGHRREGLYFSGAHKLLILGRFRCLLLFFCKLGIWHRLGVRLANLLLGRRSGLEFRGTLGNAEVGAVATERSVTTWGRGVNAAKASCVCLGSSSHGSRPHKSSDTNLMLVRNGPWARPRSFSSRNAPLVLVQLRQPSWLRLARLMMRLRRFGRLVQRAFKPA